jgi:hypothetical protein
VIYNNRVHQYQSDVLLYCKHNPYQENMNLLIQNIVMKSNKISKIYQMVFDVLLHILHSHVKNCFHQISNKDILLFPQEKMIPFDYPNDDLLHFLTKNIFSIKFFLFLIFVYRCISTRSFTTRFNSIIYICSHK